MSESVTTSDDYSGGGGGGGEFTHFTFQILKTGKSRSLQTVQ